MKPLYKWAGGKTKLINNDYKPYLPKSFSTYCEPFFGGGAMFTWAYKQNPSAKFIINDVNSHIMDIYRSIKSDYSNFRKYLDNLESQYIPLKTPKDIETNKALQKKHALPGRRNDWQSIYNAEPSRRHFYFMMRDVYAFQFNTLTKTEESALLYFLMQTGFNGVWQINTNTNGRFGTPCGLLKEKTAVYNKDNMDLWHKALQNTDIRSDDFAKCLGSITSDTFLFMDPPYRGCFTNYGTQDDDQFQDSVVDFYKRSKAIGAYCMLSNRELGDKFFENRFNPSMIKKFDITYTVGRRKKEIDENGNKLFSAKKAIEILVV